MFVDEEEEEEEDEEQEEVEEEGGTKRWARRWERKRRMQAGSASRKGRPFWSRGRRERRAKRELTPAEVGILVRVDLFFCEKGGEDGREGGRGWGERRAPG